MPMGISFSGKLSALFASFIDNAFERWQMALAETRSGTYTADHAAQDVVNQCSDYLQLVTFSGTAYAGTQSFVVTFNFARTAPTATSGPVPFPNFPFTPSPTSLDRAGGGGSIPATHIAVTYTPASRILTVDLSGLNTLNLAAGTYTGDLHDPSNPTRRVANMQATVS